MVHLRWVHVDVYCTRVLFQHKQLIISLLAIDIRTKTKLVAAPSSNLHMQVRLNTCVACFTSNLAGKQY